MKTRAAKVACHRRLRVPPLLPEFTLHILRFILGGAIVEGYIFIVVMSLSHE